MAEEIIQGNKKIYPWYLRFWFIYFLFGALSLICLKFQGDIWPETYRFFNMFVPFGFWSLLAILLGGIGLVPLFITLLGLIFVDQINIKNAVMKILFNLLMLFLLTLLVDLFYMIALGCDPSIYKFIYRIDNTCEDLRGGL